MSDLTGKLNFLFYRSDDAETRNQTTTTEEHHVEPPNLTGSLSGLLFSQQLHASAHFNIKTASPHARKNTV